MLRFASALCLVLGAVGCATQVRTTHYLGVFDPQGQAMLQELYKVDIHGYSPWFHKLQYGSGWVASEYADLLTRTLKPDEKGGVSIGGESHGKTESPVRAERHFFEIGPLGISTEPTEDRFVVVMSADPDFFFKKVATLASLGKEPALKDARRVARDALLKEIAAEQRQALDMLQGAIDQDKDRAKSPSAPKEGK